MTSTLHKIIKPIYFSFSTLNECHLHIDSWMPAGFLQASIPDFYIKGKQHNFDHFVRDDKDLNIFHGNEPIEHASKYFNYSDTILDEMRAECSQYLKYLNENKFKGYLEYELVQECYLGNQSWDIDHSFKIPFIAIQIPKISRVKTKLNPNQLYYETHLTIPVELLRNNIELFKATKLRGVSLDKIYKNGSPVKHIVLTGLYEDVELAKEMFLFIHTLDLHLASKFEQKMFMLPSNIAQLPDIFILKRSND
jgi:hypothetical protein